MSVIPIKDKEWFTAGVLEYQDHMYRIAYNILQNEEDAKDALQEALIRAYSNLNTLRNPEKFRPWIMQILINCAKDACRSRSRIANIQLNSENECLLWSKDNCDPALDSLWLHSGIRKLDEKSRLILILHYFEGMDLRDISRILGITVSSVKVRLMRARQKLKKLLSEEVYENGQT